MSINVIDLFAGAGGLSEGFHAFEDKSGATTFDVKLSIEKDPQAHATLVLRHFFHQFKNTPVPRAYYDYIKGDISIDCLIDAHQSQWRLALKRTGTGPLTLGVDNQKIHRLIGEALGSRSEPWLLVGGPPCQAYSLSGRVKNKSVDGYVPELDNRHFLYQEYLQVISKFSPDAFIMENVKGLLSSRVKNQKIFDRVLSDLKSDDNIKGCGYELFSINRTEGLFEATEPSSFVIKSENHGIPQSRHRLILLGIRKDLLRDRRPQTLNCQKPMPVAQVLSDLPRLRSGQSKNDDRDKWQRLVSRALVESKRICADRAAASNSALPTSRGSKYIQSKKHRLHSDLNRRLKKWLADPRLEGVIDHETRSHMDSDIERYNFCATFGEKNERSPRLNDFPDYLLPNHANIRSGHFVDRFRVQLQHKPATTITSHIAKDGHYFIHYDPEQSRSLTVREAARIQTFPDNFFFAGNRTQQYTQIGNAVPPYLSLQIAEIVAEYFR